MSDPKQPGRGKGPKGFLSDDESLELDAWDATFDALHGGPEAAAATGSEPVMAWPAPADSRVGDRTDLVQAGATLVHDLADGPDELDEQMTLDGVIEEPAYARAPSETLIARYAGDPLETDFSDVGAGGPPAALGDLLGAVRLGPSRPPAAVDEDLETRVRGPAFGGERAGDRGATIDLDADEDDIYTSASRPRAPSLGDSFDVDPIAPPPLPEVRRHAATVRRGAPPASAGYASDFGDSTKIIAPDELEQHTEESRTTRQRATTRETLPPPAEPEEDEYEIEIDAEPRAESESERAPSDPPVIEIASGSNSGSNSAIAIGTGTARRTAHVLRRGDAPTRPPPTVSGTITPIEPDDVEAAQPRGATGDEDDFSDVAAALGATAAATAAGPAGLDDALDGLGGLAELDGRDELPTPQPLPPVKPATRPLQAVTTIEVTAPRTVTPTRLETPSLDIALDFGEESYADEAPSVDARQATLDLGGVVTSDGESGDRDVTRSEAPEGALDVPYPGDADDPDDDDAADDPSDRAPTTARAITSETAVHPQPLPIATPRTALAATPAAAQAAADAEPRLALDTVGRAWPEQVAPLATAALDEACAQMLLVYEREVATLDESGASAALRIEAGRLSERLNDADRARAHYDAALMADPRATAALRGLRRIARATGDLVEATRQIDAEIAVAGALERRPLGHYRVDLLMASGEQDLARVAVGEILDSAPSDVRALLAHLELAFLDGRTDELGAGLEQLAHAVTDPELRAAVQSARGVLAAHHRDADGAIGWFNAAADSDPAALAARLGAIRHAAAQTDSEATARALFELGRQLVDVDPITAAATGVRALQWVGAADQRDLAAGAIQLAMVATPTDPLVTRLAAEVAVDGGDPAAAGLAFGDVATHATSAAERAYGAARAAELDPGRGVELWAQVLALDPGDDYAAAQLRTAHVAIEATQAAIDVDLTVASDPERDRARLRAAYGLIALGQTDVAIDILASGRAARPQALALAEALGEALAGAGKWLERARLFAELAADPGEQLDREVAQLRSALAWEEAVGAAGASVGDNPEPGDVASADLRSAIREALTAWDRVATGGAAAGQNVAATAHAAMLVLATRLGDREMLDDVLTRAQSVERAPLVAASLGLKRARLAAITDLELAESILRELRAAAPPLLDDPRRTAALVLTAARKRDLGDAATALEDRASQLDARGAAPEVAALRLRAAQLALDDGDAARATRLLQQVEQALPTLGVVPDLLAAARRRAGDRPTVAPRRADISPGASSADAFARIVRDADLASLHGDDVAAVALYQQALELHPGDPIAAVPLVRVASKLDDPDPVTALALTQLRAAEDAGDAVAKASAYELLAHVDEVLRSSPASAQISLEAAVQADPLRMDLRHRLERHYAAADQLADLFRLRQLELAAVDPTHRADRMALLVDLAALGVRDNRGEDELAALYRETLAVEPRTRLALMHLESIVRRGGVSDELAQLEEAIADYFEGDPKTQAAFWTRAGGTLAELGKIDEAVARFGKAEGALPGHVPALEGWRHAALKGQLWIDVAEAASRHAAHAPDASQRAVLHHFAGVALMDKALEGEQAQVALRRALDAVAGHRDSFLRLRILLEEDANHDDLATLLAQRLEVEPDAHARTALHRALAELHRNFLSDREAAKLHYRAILEADPSDLRSHSALADIAWEQGNWQEAADELMARARLERQPDILRTLCFRLGLIYADRLVDVPMALKAFQRALTYEPDDENTLIRLADLAVQVGEWKLALGACERLVKNETDPDRRAAHLQRVAKIFKDGFGDIKRAERALNLALDGAPTNDDALQQLVQFYREQRDLTSVRVHLNRVAGTMRARVARMPNDGIGYRVISRALVARAATGQAGSQPVARAAAELAQLLGAAGEPEIKLLQAPTQPDLSLLMKADADEVLFPRGAPLEIRQMFQLLGDRVAKHVGVDLRPYGVTRGDRLRARENPTATVAQSVATQMGFGEIDVYVSTKLPWAMVAEPTSPVSLVLGAAVAAAGGDAIRFATGAALHLARVSLAIPARLAVDELGVLVTALLRLFQPDFPGLGVDTESVASQLQKLRRLIPTGLLNELRPYALAVDGNTFGHHELAQDLRMGGLRAGLVASSSLLAGLTILAGQLDTSVASFLADPVAQALITFALGEDHAAIAR